jgi:hypothetical protein
MPFTVRMPDGKMIQGIPDGTPKEAIRAKWVKMIEAEDRERYSPDKGMSTSDKFWSGMGSQMEGRRQSLGNLVGKIPGMQYSSLGAALGAGTDGTSDAAVQETAMRDAPLRATGAAKAGSLVGDVALGSLGGAGLAGAAASGAALGATNPGQTDPAERLKDTLMGGGLGLGGAMLGRAGSRAIDRRLSESAIRKAQDAPKLATLEAGQKLGLVVPPATTNPRLANRMLESFAGKEAIEQEAALHNAPLMQDAMRKFLGLPRASPMTVETLEQLRNQAGAAYDEVKGLGGAMLSDSKFLRQLKTLEGSAGSASRSFPGLGGNTIREALAPLRQLQFRGDDAVDAVKALREAAKESFRAGQSGLGRAQKGAASAMEDLIERNIERQVGLGKVGGDYARQTLQRFRDARKIYAKSYAVESIINRATGNVQGAKAAKLLAKGAPITGELRDVAKFAAAYGSTAREPTRSAGVNALTTLFGVEAAMLGHPAPLLLPPARFAMGKALLSKPYQRAMATPRYRPGTKIPRLAQGLGRAAAPAYFSMDADEEIKP